MLYLLGDIGNIKSQWWVHLQKVIGNTAQGTNTAVKGPSSFYPIIVLYSASNCCNAEILWCYFTRTPWKWSTTRGEITDCLGENAPVPESGTLKSPNWKPTTCCWLIRARPGGPAAMKQTTAAIRSTISAWRQHLQQWTNTSTEIK